MKNLTLDKILQRYNDIFNVNKQWKSSFYLECGKQYSEKRALSEYYREPKEILLVHEQLKKKLIRKIQDNNALVNPKDPIDENSLSPENPVNIINYIDLAAKTKKGDIVFFEIKTATEARLCIRQALGQLMEYSFYPYENIMNRLMQQNINEWRPTSIFKLYNYKECSKIDSCWKWNKNSGSNRLYKKIE